MFRIRKLYVNSFNNVIMLLSFLERDIMNSLVETKTEIDNFVIEYETVLVNESDNYLE